MLVHASVTATMLNTSKFAAPGHVPKNIHNVGTTAVSYAGCRVALAVKKFSEESKNVDTSKK